MNRKPEKRPKLALLQKDKWLEPTEQDIIDRYERYKSRLAEIENEYGSIEKFADAHKYYGINYDPERKGWYYREWAPAAQHLLLFGDFNDWERFAHPLSKNKNGDWEIFIDEGNYKDKFTHQSRIKVLIHSQIGYNERIPAYIRRVVQDQYTQDYSGQVWNPEKKFDWRGDKKFDLPAIKNPLIYECHVGMAQEKEGIGTYLEFADTILPRIKNAGYNVIQVMAVAEHPYYGSFGYHVSNFFAPSSRFGTPEELKYMIKKAHSMGIAVIMDIVHSHTVKNVNEGLNLFDGTADQYFHPGGRGEHPAWDSKLFNYGKKEVLQFLLSNLKYWMEEFHFDGFRFDGITSMMYFHHGHGVTFDSPEKYFREGVEWDAITYLQLANKLIHEINPHAISIAEDVSGMPGLCTPIEDGGLGFDYRLGMGLPDFWIRVLKEKKDEDWSVSEMWHVMNDRTPETPTIAYCESHDQALVGDKTIAFRLMDKEMYYHMQKNDENLIIERGIALHKMIRLFTATLGGQAYMNFMGNEFGHPEWIDFPREGNNWSYKYARRQWSLRDNPDLKYEYLADFDIAMIELIKKFDLLTVDYGKELWIDEERKIIIYQKKDVLFVFNFHHSHSATDYEFIVPHCGTYKIILNSDNPVFGGHNRIDENISYIALYDKEQKNYRMKIYSPNRTAIVYKKLEPVKKDDECK